MRTLEAVVERFAKRVGGPRVLALPLIRALAVMSGYAWLALAPPAYRGWDAVDSAMLAFLLYSTAVITALWVNPPFMLRLNFAVLLADLVFALALIHLTGGAGSSLFLALLLIAGLQSYYYGIIRGVLVAAGSAVAYVVLVWPTVTPVEWANIALRLSVLLGTSIGVGILANVEERDRFQVLALSTESWQREQFIRGVVDSLTEWLLVLDREGRVVTCNPAMETKCGMSAKDAVGRHVFDVNPNFARESLAEPLQRLLRGDINDLAIEAMEHRTIGTLAPTVLNVKGSLLRQRGVPAGAVLLFEDITGQVALERAARQADKLAALGTLAAGLAHELNNPIGIMSSRIELMLLEAHALPPALREDLDVLHRHAGRVTRIVQGLLSFARQSGRTMGPVDLNQVVEETLLLVEKQITKDGIALARRLTPGLPAIQGDPTALQQVLMNLLINAREAMTGRGEILVETDLAARRPDQVRLSVHDTGPGISPEVLSRIFEPFFTTKPDGTGLGLSISYGIVREHQGTLDVDSAPGRGTTFVLTFPTNPALVTA